MKLRQRVVYLICHRLKPVGAALFRLDRDGNMGKPAVLGRAVPVLDVGGNLHNITGVKLSYVLTEEEIRTCMRGTQFGKRRKRRMRIELVVFSALLLGFLVFFFLKRNPDNLFFATVCAAMIFIMIFLPDIRIKQDAKRNANGKEICMEIYPHKIEMGRGENQWEIPLDGSCKSAIYQKNIVVYFKGDDMVILPMRCVEPSVLPEVRAMIQAGTQPREE